MKKPLVLVTGATGFIGRHTVEALLDSGHRVRALCRSDEPALARAGAEVMRGDVLVRASIDAAMKDVSFVVHGAGLVSRDARDNGLMMRLHVDGTRMVCESAVAHGVSRVVHVSTSGVVAVGVDRELVFREDDPVPFSSLVKFPYYLSKWLGERAAEDALRNSDVELITLNPSLALGPGDTRGSSTVDVRRFLNRELPIVPSGGFSFVDARDVAAVVVNALTQGTPGERYLLGALNCTFANFFERLTQVSGVQGPPVPMVMPRRMATWGVAILERVADAMGAKLPVTTEEAEMASHFWYVDPRKAERELGFVARDPMTTMLDTVKDIRGQARSEKLVAGAAKHPSMLAT